ncbi:hypothetical protein KP509_19G069800 [Ceratopteris richardii]|uniref:Uncharacterized protein n=1 Tax=Ceratopteris richardii TaxID=49495 RepID=A0A8T2SLH5_CERRI|nr:hypothetical protein KP509_19G069800 [Ceratopteris richardii]
MAAVSPSTSTASPREGVIGVLVGALADESVDVREAATSALQENARWNAKTILECCMKSLRTVRRRVGQQFSHHARVFHVMAFTVRVMDEHDLDIGAMRKIAKLAVMEIISNKDDAASVWQRAASALLVSIGSRLPDLMMEEIFLQLTGSSVSAPSIVQTLADFAASEALQFTPRVKGVLSRILPMLGCVKDNQRAIFANAFKNWCRAISQYYDEYPATLSLDSDTLAFLHSAFELFLGTWVTVRDKKVRLTTMEALGELISLISDSQRKAALPRFLPVILNMYKRDKENILPVTRSLGILLNAVLRPHSGISPLLDFQGLHVVIATLLPLASAYNKTKVDFDSSMILRISNEVLSCFYTIGTVYSDETFAYLMSRLGNKDDSVRLGAVSVFQHLLPRLHVTWVGHRSQLLEAVRPGLTEQDPNLRKALVELTLSMASCGWLEKGSGEFFIEYLIKQCALSDDTVKFTGQTAVSSEMTPKSIRMFKTELKISSASPSELRAMCDKAMLLLAGTMPEMELIMWPYLLKLIVVADYTGAVGTICKCLSEILRRKEACFSGLEVQSSLPNGIPKPEEILARMLILLQNPFGRGQLAFQILTVLNYLGTLFPKPITLLWEDEIPKLKSYIADLDDLKSECWQQATWDDMIIHLLAESLDVNQNTEWILSLGNALSDQYTLYIGDHTHSSLLHRCLGVLLQRVDNRFYVREKLEIMFKFADVTNVINRLGLAMGFGLVAATHLDTVLEKLKRILESQNRNTFQKFFAIFVNQQSKTFADDVYAALALMYGYTASYASSSVIEARIDALVGTNMLSGLLDVRTATAKQAVITAIDLLGQSVIKASTHGQPFPLKKRDELLGFVLTLMAGEDNSIDLDQLQTQVLALNACTTLVSVEPKLTSTTRDTIIQATLQFLALPVEPKSVVDSLISKLTKLLRSILLTSGEDGRSKAVQLQFLLRSLDQYVSSSVASQRSRACSAVLNLLSEFRGLCTTGSCALGCVGPCMHLRSSTTRAQKGGMESTLSFLLPSRESLNLGERVMAYLPRCADPVPSVPKCSAQILDLLFSIAMLLPNPVGSTDNENKPPLYAALSKLEELIAVSRWERSTDNNGIFIRIVECVGNLLTTEELAIALRGCTGAICDKTLSSAKAMAGAVSQLIQYRGKDLEDMDIERITHSLLAAVSLVGDSGTKTEALEAVCSLAAHTERKVVFDELLAAAEKDITTKDVTRLKVWPVLDAFCALAQNEGLSLYFLDHIVAILNRMPENKDSMERIDANDHISHHLLHQLPQAALVAISAFFRRGSISRQAIQQRYAAVLCAFLLQFGTYHTVAVVDVQPLRNTIKAFQEFSDCLGDQALKKILAQDGDQILASEQWTVGICQIASCAARSRPAEVERICMNLWMVLKRPNDSHRAVAAAVLSEYVHQCNDMLLKKLVDALSDQIGDESSVVRRLCVKGLIEIPKEQLPNYAPQVLTVLIALIEDSAEEVAATVVRGLIVVLEYANEDTVAPVLLNLCRHLRTLQLQRNVDIRAASFGALGALTRFGFVQHESFIEQVHAALPRVLFHLQDEALLVRETCKDTLKHLLTYLNEEEAMFLTNSRAFNSNDRSNYEIFLKEFARVLVRCQMRRMDNYITIAIQNYDSSWPEIQANAAFFTACLLAELVDQKLLAVHLPQVVGSLVRMAANSTGAIVRASSVHSLSILLNTIH